MEHLNWITGLIAHMEAAGHRRVDTTEERERRWNAEVQACADRTLYKRADSWYTGANIPGKPRTFMIYVGGFDRYIRRCCEQADAGYEGFDFA